MSKIFGIDVSLWQKGFNFAKAKEEGVKFAILKAGQAGYADPQFENHYKAAKEAGLDVGAYHYLVATTPEQAKEHATFMVNNCLKGKTFEYPIFVDVEDKVLRLGAAKLNLIVKAFCEVVEGAGYWAGIYCNYDFYKNQLSGAELAKRYSLWLASWTKEPPVDCQMWQFGGETNLIRTNKVAGVTCDQNYSYMDFPALIKEKGLNGFKKAPVETTQKPIEKPAEKPAQKPVVNSSGTTYVVKKGDSLSAIASKFGTTWQELAEYNKLDNPSLIYAGQEIKIPKSKTPDKTPSKPVVNKVIGIGSAVKMQKGAPIYGSTKTFAEWVYNSTLYVREMYGDRVVISTQKTGAVTGAVHKNYLALK